MARFGLTLTEEMDRALEQQSEQTRIPKAELVRIAIQDYLRCQGVVLEEKLYWGSKPKAVKP